MANYYYERQRQIQKVKNAIEYLSSVKADIANNAIPTLSAEWKSAEVVYLTNFLNEIIYDINTTISMCNRLKDNIEITYKKIQK